MNNNNEMETDTDASTKTESEVVRDSSIRKINIPETDYHILAFKMDVRVMGWGWIFVFVASCVVSLSLLSMGDNTYSSWLDFDENDSS
ncbi:unnamed protein product [Allacma fusca]|uniref:Uncharacterized protein n=1 Tax=Allacma fusca TaxID=39272 RepID=A0A8J2KET6_9HEXA|nr:unnamed protein product [Allacma fusca]